MSGSIAWALGLASAALAIATGPAMLTGSVIARDRGAAPALPALRTLTGLPAALIGLALLGLWPAGGLPAIAIASLAISAYAQLSVAVAESRAQLGGSVLEQALALGIAPARVGRELILPALAPRLAGAGLRCGARLLGEAGLFVLLAGLRGSRLPVAGAEVVWRAQSDPRGAIGLALLLAAAVLGLVLVAGRVERTRPARRRRA